MTWLLWLTVVALAAFVGLLAGSALERDRRRQAAEVGRRIRHRVYGGDRVAIVMLHTADVLLVSRVLRSYWRRLPDDAAHEGEWLHCYELVGMLDAELRELAEREAAGQGQG